VSSGICWPIIPPPGSHPRPGRQVLQYPAAAAVRALRTALIAVLAGIGITTAMLVNVTHGRRGFIWLLLPVLLIARRLSCYPCTPRRCGQKY
jgi:hypothetical protein